MVLFTVKRCRIGLITIKLKGGAMKLVKIKNTTECPFCKSNKINVTGEFESEERSKDNLRLALEMACDNCGGVYLEYFNATPTLEISTVTEPQKFLLDS